MIPIKLISSGKGPVLSGSIPADLYIDCRGMINPFRDPILGGLSGDDPAVQEWILHENEPYVRAVMMMIETALRSAPTRNSFKREEKPLTVCFFCLAGVHRSRGMKRVIGKLLQDRNLPVEIL